MDRASDRPRIVGLRCLPRFRWLVGLGLPVFALGCADPFFRPASPATSSPVVQNSATEWHGVVRAAAEELPAPGEAKRPMPISLDTLLRLAEEHNAQIALARERVNEACLEQDIASKAWLPNVTAGVAYYRHEGGIQDFDGTLVRSSYGFLFPGIELNASVNLRDITYQRVSAERKLAINRGELTKVTTEVMLEASSTYIDLLSARTGEAISRDLEKLQEEQLERAKRLATQEKPAELQVAGIETEVAARKQTILELRRQGDAAAAKLAYLLGLGADVQLQPVDSRLLPFALVDASPAAEQLIAQALANGPGVHELEELLAVIQGGIDKAQGHGRFLPTLEMRAIEGAFGAGPGSRLDWDNRFDLSVQARWNLTDFYHGPKRLQIAHSGLTQAHLAYEDLRGKLTLGVQEARDAINVGLEQIRWCEKMLKNASDAYRISKQRLDNNVAGSSAAEVMIAIRGMEAAHLLYIKSISSYDKAQLRLMTLLGPSSTRSAAPAEMPKADGKKAL
jgi:outer membrane protein TolC